MPLYTLYPFRADGCATTLLCAELADDRAALVYARDALADHASASHVVVLDGEREVARATARALAPRKAEREWVGAGRR